MGRSKITFGSCQFTFGSRIFSVCASKSGRSTPASLYSRFKKEANDVDLAQAAQAPLSNALSLAAARLTMYCSHFHQVLDLGIARGQFALGARRYYGRDINATALPPLSTYAEIADVAAKIVSGEADRQAAEGAGYKAMALPSAAEVATELAAFTAARNASQTAEVNTNREQEEASALYPQAQQLATDICDEVEHFNRKDPNAASRRAKNRRWGVVYIYEKNEPVDPGDNTGQNSEANPSGDENTATATPPPAS